VSATTIRQEIKDELLTIPGLGGVQTLRNVHKFAYISDDVAEARAFWEATDAAGKKVVNGVMITRIAREDREPLDGKEFAALHSFRLHFQYGRLAQETNESIAEEVFEGFLEAILDKLRGNAAIFQTEGVGGQTLHPQPFADQVGRATISSVKLFGTRVWRAEVDFQVVEHFFIP